MTALHEHAPVANQDHPPLPYEVEFGVTGEQATAIAIGAVHEAHPKLGDEADRTLHPDVRAAYNKLRLMHTAETSEQDIPPYEFSGSEAKVVYNALTAYRSRADAGRNPNNPASDAAYQAWVRTVNGAIRYVDEHDPGSVAHKRATMAYTAKRMAAEADRKAEAAQAAWDALPRNVRAASRAYWAFHEAYPPIRPGEDLSRRDPNEASTLQELAEMAAAEEADPVAARSRSLNDDQLHIALGAIDRAGANLEYQHDRRYAERTGAELAEAYDYLTERNAYVYHPHQVPAGHAQA